MIADASAVTLIRQAPTGADPALVMADDGELYWVKVPGNQHGPTSMLSERLVGLAGEWLGAPVAPSRLINVPAQIADTWTFQAGGRPQAGLAHGSLVVGREAVELAELTHHRSDGNPRRAAFYIALWEWCIGDDEQFIYDAAGAMSMWSIDHGMWIGGGGQWDASLFARPLEFNPHWTGPIDALSQSAFIEAAGRLDCLTLDVARGLARGVPLEWGFTTAELDAVADWLVARASYVADRLRIMSASAQMD